MLLAVRKGKEPCLSRTPPLKAFEGGRYKQAANPAIPKIRPYREGAKKCNTAPICREVGADELPVSLSSEGGFRVCLPSGVNLICITQKSRRIGQATEGPKRDSHDMVGHGQI